MINDTTFKGDVAEILAAAELVARGYIVSRPLTNGASYDLLVDVNGKILRLQVKRISRHANGTMRVNLSSSKYHRGRTRVLYDGRVDYVIGVDCLERRFYAIGGEHLKRVEIAIRDAPTKNGQVQGTRSASDFDLNLVFPSRTMVGATGIEPVTYAV